MCVLCCLLYGVNCVKRALCYCWCVLLVVCCCLMGAVRCALCVVRCVPLLCVVNYG